VENVFFLKLLHLQIISYCSDYNIVRKQIVITAAKFSPGFAAPNLNGTAGFGAHVLLDCLTTVDFSIMVGSE